MLELRTERESQILEGILIGSGIPRIDGFERVTGRAKYGGDWKVPGMLYARIIQSTIPNGIVRSIDTNRALSTPGVEGIITCQDDNTRWVDGERVHKRQVFTDRVRFVGDCIGAIAAKSRYAAQEAVESVRVDYEELPAVFDVKKSLEQGAPKIWDDGNSIGPFEYGFGDLNSSFEKADLTFEETYSTSRIHNSPMEPAVSLAWWDEALTKLTVVAATQSIHGCREGLASDLGMPRESIRVIALYKGGGFGNKSNSMNYDIIAALLSRKTRKPVMVEYSREQDFTGVHGRWSSVQKLRAAVDRKESRVLAVDLKAHCDIGAYTRHIKIGYFVNGAEDYYSCDSWSSQVYGVYTNTPATAHMRAPTGPIACFASETMMDELSYKLGVDPLEFRMKNAVRRFHGSSDFTSSGLRECLLEGAKEFEWKERWREPSISQVNGTTNLRGVGLAIGAWHSLLGKGEASVKLKRNGTLEIHVGVVDIGTGAKTTMAAIAAEKLCIPLEKVNVVWGDTQMTPFSIGESGGRTTTFTGIAVAEAALKLRRKILSLAADQFNVEIGNLETKNGRVISNIPGKEISVAFEKLLESSSLEEIAESQATDPKLPEHTERYSFAGHFAEVEVEKDTGVIRVTDYVAAHDSGEIVNRLTAESQVQGGIVMGIGMALYEKILIDPDSGMIQNPHLFAYRLPNHTSIPRIRPIFVQSRDPYGPKSLGEVGIVPVPAAVGNAIFNATGVRLRGIPFMPENLLACLP